MNPHDEAVLESALASDEDDGPEDDTLAAYFRWFLADALSRDDMSSDEVAEFLADEVDRRIGWAFKTAKMYPHD
jgi:hypothetical protein